MSRMIQGVLPVANLKRPLAAIPIVAGASIAIAATIALPPFLSAGALAAIVAAIAFIVNPFLLPFALIASVPIQDVLPVPDGIPLTATRSAVAAGIGFGLFAIFSQKRQFRGTWLMLPLAMYISAMAISLANAVSLSSGIAEMYRWLVALVALWLVVQFVQSLRHLLITLGLIASLTVSLALTGLVQAVLGLGPASFQVTDSLSRAFGPFGMPNSYAAYMETAALPLVPVGLWALRVSWQKFQQFRLERVHGFARSASARRQFLLWTGLSLFLLSAAAFGLLGILLSFSRGGWLATIAALGVTVVLLGHRAIITATAALLTAILGLLVTGSAALLNVFVERIVQLREQIQFGDISGVPLTGDNFATLERMSHWQTAIAMWNGHPWIGIGAGNFDAQFRTFAVHPQFIHSQGHAHNYYLHALAETGLIGLILYIVLLASAMIVGIRAYRSGNQLTSAIGLGSIAMTVAIIVHNVFENPHVLNISVQIAAIWALSVVAVRLSDEHETAPAPGTSARPSGSIATATLR